MSVARAAASALESRALESRLVRVTSPVKTSMSKRIWGLDWSTELPWTFDDATLEAGSFADAMPFIREHYQRIFGDASDGRFYVEQMTEAKRRFGDEMDVFVFRSSGQTVGIAIAHPTDWSTYYVRSFAVLPEFRERRFCTEFVERIIEPLRRVGVDRFESDCSVANQPMVRLCTSQGMLATSMLNSERWGMTVRFTKFLNEDAQEVFRRQFLNVPAFGRNPNR